MRKIIAAAAIAVVFAATAAQAIPTSGPIPTHPPICTFTVATGWVCR